MKYRQLGKWGVRLSVLGLGSYLTIGYKVNEETSRQLVRTAYEHGVNFFDTANAYNLGKAEEVLGRCLSEFPRSSLFVITKVWGRMGDGPNDRGLSAKHIKEQCEASLRRLQMDYIDLYMCHRPDPDTPLEETIRAMEDLARQGKIIYWGVSEWPAWMMVKANHIARDLGARPIAVNEPRYNLLWRYPEKEVFPVTLSEGIGNVTFSPLAHGLLTGKYKPGEPPPPNSRAADPDQNMVLKELYWTEENKRKGQELVSIAAKLGTTAATLSIAWAMRHPAVTSVILGARTVTQLEENLKAVDLEIPPEILTKLEELYPVPQSPVGL
ncbi:MAG: aldo/keto reductase family protein [Anaerolineae bacterium]|nr:aldo/keto reductase family protein [Anaerolineae bacterium]